MKRGHYGKLGEMASVRQITSRLSRLSKARHEKFNDKNDISLFRTVKQTQMQNQDIVGEKRVKDDKNKLAFSDAAKKITWKHH